MINIKELGITYTVVDKNKKFFEVQIIFLDAFLDKFDDINEDTNIFDYYMCLQQAKLDAKGFYSSIADVTWYVETREKSDIIDAVKKAMDEGNNVVVIEYTD